MDKRIRQPGALSRMIQNPNKVKLTRREGQVTHSETLKAAILAALVIGTPSSQIALQYGLPLATVRKWESSFDISNPVQREGRLGEMIMIFLEQEIASLLTISMVTQDEEWILKQSATDLSTYVATKQDRVMKVLEAFGRAQTSEPPTLEG